MLISEEKLLKKKLDVPEDQIIILVNKKYVELPAALKYEIETSGIDKKDLTVKFEIHLTRKKIKPLLCQIYPMMIC